MSPERAGEVSAGLTRWALGIGPDGLAALGWTAVIAGTVLLLLTWCFNGAQWVSAWRVWGTYRKRKRRTRRGRTAPSGTPHPDRIEGRPTRSDEYRWFMQSAAWKLQRARILARDGHRCRDCGHRARDAHHRWYADPIETTPDDALVALCSFCHHRRHTRPSFVLSPGVDGAEGDRLALRHD